MRKDPNVVHNRRSTLRDMTDGPWGWAGSGMELADDTGTDSH